MHRPTDSVALPQQRPVAQPGLVRRERERKQPPHPVNLGFQPIRKICTITMAALSSEIPARRVRQRFVRRQLELARILLGAGQLLADPEHAPLVADDVRRTGRQTGQLPLHA